ncbi:MAG: hypothetical protein Q4G09_01230 [Clostridia bacterium]|nr:hypothetical protein [Clostridia bacterium]
MIKEIIKFIIPFQYEESKMLSYYRISRFLQNKHMNFLSQICKHRIYVKYHCIISPKAIIGKKVRFPHPIGIIIGEGSVIKDKVTIYQNVTIGRKTKNENFYPIIEENSIIYGNSMILGNVIIEKNTVVGANSLVLKNTECNSIYAGSPAKKIK